ncbi:hypothetical protein Gohar_004526 [Gossypium harknessii]|uniref:Uncharacterized protein n=1 Tax=Gossypium harknessii TaxID=34285 RepID=A0A7J9H537_9ROSI|nr:hypothetical protein [Gossypium harknessii]
MKMLDVSRCGFGGLLLFSSNAFVIIREFVNNVWYIKILSPLEVQQMGKEGLNPAASDPSQTHHQ